MAPTYLHTVALRDNSVREHPFDEPITIDIFVDAALPNGVDHLTSDDLKNFKPNMFLTRKKDRSMAKLITSTMTVRKARRDWLKRCNYSGLALLPMLKEKLDEIGPIANDAAAARIAELVAAGPGEISMAAFNSWRDEFDMWNATQSGDAVIVDPLLSQKYTAAVRKLGKEISNDLKNEIRINNARGNSELVLKCIETAITEWEVQHYDASAHGSGGGLTGGTDPRRNLPPSGGGKALHKSHVSL